MGREYKLRAEVRTVREETRIIGKIKEKEKGKIKIKDKINVKACKLTG